MQSRTRTLSTALALTTLVLAAPPCAADDSLRAAESKVPIIRVVVDHENQLALIPEGTVLPAGFQIISSKGLPDDDRGSKGRFAVEQRPLVFAYAPAERFVGVEPRTELASEDGQIYDLSGEAAPEARAAGGGNPCPAIIVVEVGPQIVHQVSCTYEFLMPGRLFEVFRGFLYYPDTAVRVNYSKTTDYPPPHPDATITLTCPVPGTVCSSEYSGFTVPFFDNVYQKEKAIVRLPGACTQDPAYCPTFSNTISLPIVSP